MMGPVGRTLATPLHNARMTSIASASLVDPGAYAGILESERPVILLEPSGSEGQREPAIADALQR
jgi:hypothetical protein